MATITKLNMKAPLVKILIVLYKVNLININKIILVVFIFTFFRLVARPDFFLSYNRLSNLTPVMV